MTIADIASRLRALADCCERDRDQRAVNALAYVATNVLRRAIGVAEAAQDWNNVALLALALQKATRRAA